MLLTNPAATLRRRGHLPMAKHSGNVDRIHIRGERSKEIVGQSMWWWRRSPNVNVGRSETPRLRRQEVVILRSLLAKTDCPCCYHRGCQRSQGRLVDIFTASGRAHCAIFNLKTLQCFGAQKLWIWVSKF